MDNFYNFCNSATLLGVKTPDKSEEKLTHQSALITGLQLYTMLAWLLHFDTLGVSCGLAGSSVVLSERECSGY